MIKVRGMFKGIVVNQKIQKLVIKEKCSPMLDQARPCSSMLAHSFSTGSRIRKFYFKLTNRRHDLSEPSRLTNG